MGNIVPEINQIKINHFPALIPGLAEKEYGFLTRDRRAFAKI
jgi:hypothetical protein